MSEKKMAAAAVGIRVGGSTLTLAVARLAEGFDKKPNVVASDSGERTTPALVGLNNGEWVLGEAAKQQAAKNQKATFGNLVALLGAEVSESTVAQLAKGQNVERKAGGELLLQPIDQNGEAAGPSKSPSDLLALLFSRLKEIAEENVGGGKVQPCVLTVPGYFSEEQRVALAKAGAAAGLDVLQVLSEATAAALGQGVDMGRTPSTAEEMVVVVDLGASCLEVTVLCNQGGVLSVAAAERCSGLSGDQMVQRLAKFAAAQFLKKVTTLVLLRDFRKSHEHAEVHARLCECLCGGGEGAVRGRFSLF